jgi:hypothetical protein
MLRGLLFTAACLLGFARAACGVDASVLFADGERAFAAGDYGEALRLFTAAREAGSAGPSSYYNIGVSQYLLRDYGAAEDTFAALAAEFPAMRELAEYNRGLALRADGNLEEARVAFARARSSDDEKIASLANAQLGELGSPPRAAAASWSAYVLGGLGYDDNVALLDDLLLPTTQASSPLAELLAVASRDFGARPLRLDATGYSVRYPEVGELDQTALRLALTTDQSFGSWLLAAGPMIGRSTVDGDGFEELLGADLRLRRGLGSGFTLEARAAFYDVTSGEPRFAYLDGARRQVRLGVQHLGSQRLTFNYDFEDNDRADPGVSAERERWSLLFRRRVSSLWTADAALTHRTSRYAEASTPRTERLVELSLAATRDLRSGWSVGADYRWSDNDSNVSQFAYEAQRVALSLSRSFERL